jgi:hypothetical protein
MRATDRPERSAKPSRHDRVGPPLAGTPTDLGRRRITAAGAGAALGGALGYVAGRAYFHLIVGAGAPTLIVREARVNFHLALVIASFVALVSGLSIAELARTERRLTRVERALERGALPTLLVAMALVFLWP